MPPGRAIFFIPLALFPPSHERGAPVSSRRRPSSNAVCHPRPDAICHSGLSSARSDAVPPTQTSAFGENRQRREGRAAGMTLAYPCVVFSPARPVRPARIEMLSAEVVPPRQTKDVPPRASGGGRGLRPPSNDSYLH